MHMIWCVGVPIIPGSVALCLLPLVQCVVCLGVKVMDNPPACVCSYQIAGSGLGSLHEIIITACEHYAAQLCGDYT